MGGQNKHTLAADCFRDYRSAKTCVQQLQSCPTAYKIKMTTVLASTFHMFGLACGENIQPAGELKKNQLILDVTQTISK